MSDPDLLEKRAMGALWGPAPGGFFLMVEKQDALGHDMRALLLAKLDDG